MGEAKSSDLSRRRFLQTSAPWMGLTFCDVNLFSAFPISQKTAPSVRQEITDKLRELVNAERYLAGVGQLEIDDLACRVAMSHAVDMAQNSFVSHWGSDGRKPYHRYSFAGGIHATQENVAAIDNFFSGDWADLTEDLISLHVRMHGENPPRDGHRKAILAPQHTHVGFGFAAVERRLRLVEIYVAKYAEVVGFQSRVPRDATLDLSGKLLSEQFELQQIDVFYETLPVKIGSDFFNNPRSYELPDEFQSIRPKLREDMRYPDGTRGALELQIGRRFRAPINLYKGSAGIYTIVLWVNRQKSEDLFAATEICIEAT